MELKDLDSLFNGYLIVEKDNAAKAQIERALPHTRGTYPKKLIEAQYPHEPQYVRDFRKEIWQPITTDAVSQQKKALTKTLFANQPQYSAPSNTINFIDSYGIKSSVGDKDVITYHYDDILSADIEDANAVLAWVFDYVYTDEMPSINQAPKIKPLVINSGNYRIKDDTLFYEINKVVYYININEWGYITKTDTKIIYNALIGLSLSDSVFPIKPFRILGGETMTINNGVRIFKSYFDSYFSWANKAIVREQNLEAVTLRMANPVVVRYEMNCDECDGTGIVQCADEHSSCECPKCHGKKVKAISPYEDIVLPNDAGVYGAEIKDPYKYIMPPTDAISTIEKTFYALLDKAKESISLTKVNESLSGVAKELDLEGKVDLLTVICNNINSLLEFSISCIAGYLDQSESQNIIFKYPSQYVVTSIAARKEVLINAKSLPDIERINTTMRVINAEYRDDANMLAGMKFLAIKDPMFSFSFDEVTRAQQTGYINSEIVRIHKYGAQVIALMLGDIDLIGKSYDEINTIFESYLIKFPQETSLINGLLG